MHRANTDSGTNNRVIADPLAPANRPTVRVEAQHLKSGLRIAAVEDVRFDPPVLIEQVIHDVSFEIPIVKTAVWHATWMFGLEFAPDDQVEVAWDFDGRTSDLPPAPSRDGLVRVHGTWYPPEDHPYRSAREAHARGEVVS